MRQKDGMAADTWLTSCSEKNWERFEDREKLGPLFAWVNCFCFRKRCHRQEFRFSNLVLSDLLHFVCIMALAVAIFSKEKSLIFFQCSPERINEETPLQMMAYSSLDVLDEREKVPSNRPQELFQGCLLSNNSYKTFGYLTNTLVKVFLIFAADSTIRDQDIRAYFKQLHNQYSDEVANPFYVPNTVIRTTRFRKFVNSIFA
uniref:Trafficking protein particle complex subunit n=1 Tax=Bursaphelenchus xylophilus TaxID=6326 RepID=A0A1I7SQL2_BURXY